MYTIAYHAHLCELSVQESLFRISFRASRSFNRSSGNVVEHHTPEPEPDSINWIPIPHNATHICVSRNVKNIYLVNQAAMTDVEQHCDATTVTETQHKETYTQTETTDPELFDVFTVTDDSSLSSSASETLATLPCAGVQPRLDVNVTFEISIR